MTTHPSTQKRIIDPQLSIGILLVAVAWGLSWLPEFTGDPETLRTHLLFFPLWLGYILIVDTLVWRRKGTSLLRRNWKAFTGLFVLSAPSWWFFELLNAFTKNWVYEGKEFFSDLEYALLASLAFSTVIPAVFVTAELVSTFGWIKRLPRGPMLQPTPRTLAVYVAMSLAMFLGIVTLPRVFFPCLWLAPYFMLAAINARLGYRSLFDWTKIGDWRPIVALGLGTLICGLFWELWNFYSYPKWVYDVPFVGVLHVFEMPLLGYGGYIPFGLELFAMTHFVIGLLGKNESLGEFIEITADKKQR
jgi:hypothetical protein